VQVIRAQRVLDLGRSLVNVALPSGAAQRGGDLAARQRTSSFWGGRHRQDSDSAAAGQAGAECRERGRVVLPQRRAQRVDLPLPRPDR
jgi:hypothetical protein